MRAWAREEDPGRWRCNAGVPEAGEASRTLCGRYRQRKKEERCQHPDAGGMGREFHEVTGEKIQKVRQYESPYSQTMAFLSHLPVEVLPGFSPLG